MYSINEKLNSVIFELRDAAKRWPDGELGLELRQAETMARKLHEKVEYASMADGDATDQCLWFYGDE